jgi:outer membrane protein TolC
MTLHSCFLFLFAALLEFSATARCEDNQPLPSPMTLEAVVNYALARQPSSRAARATEAGEEAGLEYARTNYLPELDLSAQETRATANNVPGLFFLMPGFPTIEENKNGGKFGSSAWNSSTSLFLSKDVAGLLREMALVDVALAQRERRRDLPRTS